MSASLRSRARVDDSANGVAASASASCASANNNNNSSSSSSSSNCVAPPLPYEADTDSDPHMLADDDLSDKAGHGGSSGFLSIIEPLEWKDHYRHIYGNINCAFFHTVQFVITVFLLVIALAVDRSTMHMTWYTFLEFLMILFFAVELVSRFILSRSNTSFFSNRTNLAETVLCAVCILAFVMLLYSRGTAKSRREARMEAPDKRAASEKREVVEHEIVILIRFCAQLFRAGVYLRNVIRAKQIQQASSHHGGGISLMHAAPLGGGAGGGIQL